MALNFANNWRQDITLGQGATAATLGLPDGSYRLTLTDSAQTRNEIIDAVVQAGAAVLTRGLEGTADQAWPEGSAIYCSLTAGTVQSLMARIAALEAALAPPPAGQRVVFDAAELDRTIAGHGTEQGARFGPDDGAAVDVALDLFGLPASLLVYQALSYTPEGEMFEPADTLTIALSVPGVPEDADVSGVTLTAQIAGAPSVVSGGYMEEEGVFLVELSLPSGALADAYKTPGRIELYIDVTGAPVIP